MQEFLVLKLCMCISMFCESYINSLTRSRTYLKSRTFGGNANYML